jgi:ABC-type Fe3+/spermidine/putrescine transport system ATPase subunit
LRGSSRGTRHPLPGAPILELRGLLKRFGDTVAVAGVSGAFARGEYVCLLGPSGCGKTTLLRLIAGFDEPSGGDILLEGESLAGAPPERRDVNVVFQSYALFPHLSVRENVAFGPRMRGLPAEEVRTRVSEALRLARLDGLDARLPRQLSGGQQQRVALARALVNRPRVLLLDEPLSALDRSLRVAVQEELKELQRQTGVTFLHVTHDQGEALSLADRVVVMRAGRFEQVGGPRELYQRPRNRFVAEFLGASNLIEGVMEGAAAVRADGGLLLPIDASAPASGRVVVSIRPESIEVVPARRGEPPAAAANDGSPELEGRVEGVAFNGPLVECRVRVHGHLLRALLPASADAALAEGAPVALRIPPRSVVLLEPERGDSP